MKQEADQPKKMKIGVVYSNTGMIDMLCTTGRAIVTSDAERQRVLSLLDPGETGRQDSSLW